MFNKAWFLNKFREFPLLLKFATTKIQASTDESASAKELLDWQKELYAALQEIKPEIGHAKFDELERTMLTLMFLDAALPENIKQGGLSFIKEHRFHGNPELDVDNKDIDTIWALVSENGRISEEHYKLVVLACIFGDIGKIDQIRHDFEAKGLVAQDQDLAYDYILQNDFQMLCEYFVISEQQVAYLKEHVFPLHLGHAVQGECTAKKIVDAQTFLKQLNPTEAERIIKHAIFKQIMDVAGARGQNGKILLSKPILDAYLKLSETLIALAGANANPYQVYWKHVTKPILSKNITFSDQALNNTQAAIDVDSYSKTGLIWRLILQLRITLSQQSADKIKEDALLVEKIVSILLEQDPEFNSLIEQLKDYDNNAFHTFTYGPALLSTLKSMAEKSQSCMQGIAENAIEFAIKVGIKIEALACKAYLAEKEYSPLLLENPLNLNELNGEIQKNPQTALDIYNDKKALFIQPDGKVTAENITLKLKYNRSDEVKDKVEEKLTKRCRWKAHKLLMKFGYNYQKPLLNEYPLLRTHEQLQPRAISYKK